MLDQSILTLLPFSNGLVLIYNINSQSQEVKAEALAALNLFKARFKCKFEVVSSPSELFNTECHHK